MPQREEICQSTGDIVPHRRKELLEMAAFFFFYAKGPRMMLSRIAWLDGLL